MDEQQFSSEQLEAALMEAFDLFDTALMDFFLMGQTAVQVKADKWLEGKKVELGVRGRDLHPDTIEIMKIAFPNIDIGDKKIIMVHNGVPIEVKIIKKHYRVLDHLDETFYANETFKLPNPFDAFVRMMNFMH